MSLMSLPLTLVGMATVFSATPEKVTFEDHVKPIFKNHCASCHNPEEKSSGLDLLSYTALMQGGASGMVVEGGNPDASRLFKVMTHAEEPKMPPEADKLPEAELEMVKAWIAGGLLDKADSKKMLSSKPKVNVALSSTSTEKPAVVAFPKDLLIEPLIDAKRGCAVSSIAASPWAPVVAIAAPKEVLLYNTDTLELLGILPFAEGFPHIVKFSRNGSLLLVGGGRDGQSGLVALFDVATGERITTVGDELDAVLAADISADQQMIALGGPSKLVRIYSTKTGELLHSIKKHTDWVTALEFSPDAVLLASGDRAGGLHVWESYTGQLFYTLNGHKAGVTDVSWRADSNVVASSSQDTTVWLWEMFNGTAVKNWGAHGTGVNSVDFARDGRLVTAGRDNVLKTWDGNGALLKQTEGFVDMTTAVTFTHDGGRIIGGDWTGEIRVYKADDAARVGNLSMTPPTIAERIATTEKVIAELMPKIEPAKAAYDATLPPLQKSTAEVEAARKSLADAQAAQSKADADLNAAKAAFDQATQLLAQAQADFQAKQGDSQAKAVTLANEKAALDAVIAAKAEAEKTVAVETELVNQLNAVVGNAKQAAQSKGGKVEEAAKLSEQALTQAAAALAASQEILETKSKEATDRSAVFAVAESNAKTASDLAAAAGSLVNERTGAHQTAQANVLTTEQAAAQAKLVVDQQAAGAAALEQAYAASAKVSADAKAAFDVVSAELAKAHSDRQKWEAAWVRVEWKQLHDILRQHEQVLAERNALVQESQAAVAKVQDEIVAVEKFIADGPSALASAQSAIDEAQKQIDAALAEIAAAEQVVAAKEAVRVEFEGQSMKLKTTLDVDPANESLKGALAKSQEVLALLAQDRDAAQAAVQAKKADHQMKVDAKAVTEKTKVDLEARLAEAPKQIEPLRAKVVELSAVVTSKQAEAQAASAEVDKARAATDQVAQHLATLTQAAN